MALAVIADDFGFLKAIHNESILFPGGYTAQFSMKRIALSLVLAFPALYVADSVLKSRTQLILISLIAMMVAVWF